MTSVRRNSDDVRDRIVGLAEDSLTQTIYAGAGAGTGKTQALVDRIVNLFVLGGVKPENIAAVTFTNAAASELRQRVREELERRVADESVNTTEKTTLSNALEALDSAFIGTIHSFAQSLLRERPLTVELPPVIELYDAVQGDTRFEEEWSAWLDAELANPEFSEAVINAQRLGLRNPLAALETLAEEFHANYDLVERFGDLPKPKQIVRLRDVLESVRSDVTSALGLRRCCTNPDDNLLAHLNSQIAMVVDWVNEALDSDFEEEQVLALTQVPKLTVGGGRKGDWSELPGGESSIDEVRALLSEAQSRLEEGRSLFGEATLVPLVNAVSRMVLSYARKRRSQGTLEFQDLLVLSCELLDEHEEERKYFQNRYTHVLIDEFQDTDPLQLKLAIRLANRGNDAAAPTPGALFVVGDGKQSIYRFRRADLTQLQGLIASLGATHLSLASNYRSNPEILNWVNAVFEPWMNGPEGLGDDPNQAFYEPVQPGREDYSGSEIPRVMIAGGASTGNVDEARTSEAEDLAKLAESVGAGYWQLPDGNGGLRKSTYRDLCVLMPRRTALSYLENAFLDKNIPYLLEGQAPVFESQTIHELSNNLAAIDDPTDQVAIVAALKSPSWGCSDQDLYEWAWNGLKFEYARDRDAIGEHVGKNGFENVAAGLMGLAAFHDLRQQISTPYLIEKFVRDRRLREVAALSNPGGDRERLIDLFIEMARTLQRSGTGSLREFVRWVSRQAEARVRVAEGALSNSEFNSVRVMTVHAAKGLEFPIVALMGLQVNPSADGGYSIIREELRKPGVAVRLGAKDIGLATSNYEQQAKMSKAADAAEQVRLAYVGATRAREHLIVSVHRPARDKSSLAAKINEFDDLHNFSTPFCVEIAQTESGDSTDDQQNTVPDSYSLDDRSKWIDDLNEVVRSATGRGYVTPSQLADHTMFEPTKPEDNAESTEWNPARKGRGGTEIGSVVHDVMQSVDFDDQSNLDALIRQIAENYSLEDHVERVSGLVRNTMASPTIARATSSNNWREAWVAAEVSEGAEVEGSIDLIIRNDDGTVTIVDYKTDQVEGADLQKRAEGYEQQLAGYALVLEKLGMSVREAVLVFAQGDSDGTAYEYVVRDLAAAKLAANQQILTKVG